MSTGERDWVREKSRARLMVHPAITFSATPLIAWCSSSYFHIGGDPT
jgi:hypothetical protein